MDARNHGIDSFNAPRSQAKAVENEIPAQDTPLPVKAKTAGLQFLGKHGRLGGDERADVTGKGIKRRVP